jgi:hypothetical protein
VPQSILDYYGQNWVAVEIWARQADGAHLTDFKLEAGTPAWTSMAAPEIVDSPSYVRRPGRIKVMNSSLQGDISFKMGVEMYTSI